MKKDKYLSEERVDKFIDDFMESLKKKKEGLKKKGKNFELSDFKHAVVEKIVNVFFKCEPSKSKSLETETNLFYEHFVTPAISKTLPELNVIFTKFLKYITLISDPDVLPAPKRDAIYIRERLFESLVTIFFVHKKTLTEA